MLWPTELTVMAGDLLCQHAGEVPELLGLMCTPHNECVEALEVQAARVTEECRGIEVSLCFCKLTHFSPYFQMHTR